MLIINLKLYAVCLSFKLLTIQLRFCTSVVIARGMREKSTDLISEGNRNIFLLTKLCLYEQSGVAVKLITDNTK